MANPGVKYIPGKGNKDARFVVIGQAPGRIEDQQGECFVGPAGQKLDEWLEENDIPFDAVWFTNVVKYYPPNDDFKRLGEIGVDLKEEVAKLWIELDDIKPNCILGLGGIALNTLTGKTGITKYRGSILTALNRRYKVVCTFHPAHFLHMRGGEVADASAEVYAKLDVERAWNESKTQRLELPKRHLWICKNSGQLWKYLEENKKETICAVDAETPKIYKSLPICAGLSFRSSEGVSVPLFDPRILGADWSQSRSDLAETWRLLQTRVFGNPNVKIVGQNYKFDEGKYRRIGFWTKNFWMDLGLAFKQVYPELPGNIGFINSLYGREPYWKDEGKEFNPKKRGESLVNHLLYNAKDAAVEREMVEPIIQDLREAGLEDFYFNEEYGMHLAHYLYMDMEDRGLRMDFNERARLAKKYFKKSKAIQERLDNLAGRHINVNSPQQVAALLYLELNLPKRGAKDKKTGEFKVKVDEDTIVALLNNHAKNPRTQQILQDILDERKTKKTLSTYVLSKPDADRRMRTVVNITGTETGRTSNKKLKPPVRPFECGLAFQTMTKHGDIGADLRRMFIPDPGHVFMNFDLSQAEARIVLNLARDTKGLELFDKLDIHALTASWIFGGTWDKYKKTPDGEPPERFIGKTTRHAGNYDMKKGRAMLTINTDAKKYGIDLIVSEWKAGTFLDAFHKYNPAIRGVFHVEIQQAINAERILINPFGRRREFLGKWGDELYREAYAQIPQSTVRDHLYRAMLRIRKRIPGIQYLIEAHDAFLCQAPYAEVENYYHICTEEMQKPIDFSKGTLVRPELTIPADCEISEKNYKELVKYKPKKEAA